MGIMVKTIPIQKKKFFHKTFKNHHDLHDLHDLRRKMEENDNRHWIVLVREGTYRQRREFRVDAQFCNVTQAGIAWYHHSGTLAMFVPHSRIDIVFFPGLVEA